jgi:hypothetical protein
MTLRQAQKQYDDAIGTYVSHKAYSMTIEELISIANMHYSEPCKVLFAKISKNRSRIITSLKAARL